MSHLWVQYKGYETAKIPTKSCTDVADLLDACLERLMFLVRDPIHAGQPIISLARHGAALPADDPLPPRNTSGTPLYFRINKLAAEGTPESHLFL